MTELVALLSTGKGSWSEIARLIKAQNWENVFLITDEFGMTFTAPNAQLVQVNFQKNAVVLAQDILKGLSGKVTGFEVALNMISGDGNAHMALMSAIMKMGVGFRIVTVTENGVEEV
mgnify:CR=1 FL=1